MTVGRGRTTRRALAILRLLGTVGVLCARVPSSMADVVTLEEACAAAVHTHERIAAAAADEERAAVAPWRALSALGPSVHGTGSFTREKDAIAFPTQAGVPSDSFNPLILAKDPLRASLSVTQPLYTHQFWALRDLGKSEVARSAEAYRATVQDIVLAVTAAYYDALRARTLRAVAQEAARLADAEAVHARTRLEVGETMRTDVLRAETEIARTAQRVAETTGAVEVASMTLSRLTRLREPFELEDPPPRRLSADSPAPIVATALLHNPDLQQALAALEAARAEEARREAALYPTLAVQGSYRLVNQETFVELNNFWQVVVGIEIPLFEAGGARYLDVAEQRARVKNIAAQVAGLQRDLEVDVGRAFVTARTLEQQETTAEKEAALAVDSYQLLSRQYQGGAATSLDVLTALTARAAAQSNRAVIRYAHAIALAQLDRLAGTLGVADAARPTERP